MVYEDFKHLLLGGSRMCKIVSSSCKQSVAYFQSSTAFRLSSAGRLNSKLSGYLFVFVLNILNCSIAISGDLWEVITSNNTAPGYVRFDISNDGNFFLLDNYGNIRYQDSSLIGSNRSFYKLMKNGYWSCFTIDNGVKIYDEEFRLIGTIFVPSNYKIDSHDIESLSNGHYLLLCQETRIIDMSKIVEGGQTEARVYGVILVEMGLDNEIYWTWNSFDHLTLTDATEDIDLTQILIDITHANAVAEDLDGNILVSIRHFDEIIKINKINSEIMWRLGGSASKSNEFQFVNDTENDFFGFSHQHAVTVLPNGHYLIFDNGNLKPVQYSRAVEYELDTVNMICRRIWDYREAPDIFYGNMGNAQRLPNGNTFINWGQGRIMEVRDDHSKAFDMTLESSLPIYRAFRYVTKMDAVLKNINSNGSYDFNSSSDSTGIILEISSLSGFGLSSIEKHYYAASGHYSDTNFARLLPYRWVLSKYGINDIRGKLRISLNRIENVIDARKLTIYKRNSEGNGTFIELMTRYDESNNEIYADFDGLGEFVIGSNAFAAPIVYEPENGSTGITTNGGMLEWIKVTGVTNYHIQIATDNNFQNLINDTVTGNKGYYVFYGLENYRVYYWRVASMNSKDTSDWSDVFSFRTKMGMVSLVSPNNNKYQVALSAILNWRNLNGAEFYWLDVARDSNFVDIVVRREQVMDTSINLNFEEFNRRYYWRVRAYCENDTGNWSDIWSFTSVLPIPNLTLPGDFDPNVETFGEFKWTAAASDVHFDLVLSEDMDFDSITYENDNISGFVCEYKDFKSNQDYFWKVRAVSYEGVKGDWSDAWKFSTKLEAPKLISPENEQRFKQGNIGFSWDSVPGATQYNLQIGYDSGFLYLYKEINKIDSLSYTLENVNKDMVLFWRVQPQSFYKYGNWSETRRLDVINEDELLPAPMLISPNDRDTNVETSGFLIWLGYTQGLNFDLQVSTDSEFNTLIIDSTTDTSSYFQYEGFNKDVRYYWRVRARNDEQTSDWSKSFWFKTASETIENVLTLLEPIDGRKRVGIADELKWKLTNGNNELGEREFRVEISEKPDFIHLVKSVSGLKENSFLFTDLNYFKKYFWRVGIFRDDSLEVWSDIWFFETELEPPSPISGGFDTLLNEGCLKWNEVDGAISYSFMLSEDSLMKNPIINLDGYKENAIDYNLEPEKVFYWKVKAIGNGTWSRWSDLLSFRTISGIGVEEFGFKNIEVNLYPNPVGNHLNIKLKSQIESKLNIEIISCLGEKIISWDLTIENGELKVLSYETEKMAHGIYFVVISLRDILWVDKLIVY